MDKTPLTSDQLADALEAFWNASLSATHDAQDSTANAVMAGMVEGFAAVASALRTPTQSETNDVRGHSAAQQAAREVPGTKSSHVNPEWWKTPAAEWLEQEAEKWPDVYTQRALREAAENLRAEAIPSTEAAPAEDCTEVDRLRTALRRISELTPAKANARTAFDLHATVYAIASSALETQGGR
jgi:hypothetical protein